MNVTAEDKQSTRDLLNITWVWLSHLILHHTGSNLPPLLIKVKMQWDTGFEMTRFKFSCDNQTLPILACNFDNTFDSNLDSKLATFPDCTAF